MVSINSVLKTLSDDSTLVLLDTIALLGLDKDAHMGKLGLTRKQYYSRIRSLTNAGLVTRQKEKYFLTSLGKIVSFYQHRIARALNNFWKLKALDSICNEALNDPGFKDVLPNLVNSLIDDVEMREILMKLGTPPLKTKLHLVDEINIEPYIQTDKKTTETKDTSDA